MRIRIVLCYAQFRWFCLPNYEVNTLNYNGAFSHVAQTNQWRTTIKFKQVLSRAQTIQFKSLTMLQTENKRPGCQNYCKKKMQNRTEHTIHIAIHRINTLDFVLLPRRMSKIPFLNHQTILYIDRSILNDKKRNSFLGFKVFNKSK